MEKKNYYNDYLEAMTENRRLRSLLSRVHVVTKQFYVPKDKAPDNCPYDDILALYHAKLPMLSKVSKLTDKRKAAMRKRWLNDLPALADWVAYFDDAATKKFIHGKNDREWVGNIDFILREQTITWMMEGRYDSN